jgi:ferredoxin
MKRSVIHIDETKCDGCGLCIPNCPEGAIQIIDGKARLVSDLFCDGLGACLGHCPQKAITIEEREAEPYDERRVMENIANAGQATIEAHLRHLKEHRQEEYLGQATAVLREKGIEVPSLDINPMPATATLPGKAHPAGCPGMKIMDFRDTLVAARAPQTAAPSELRQWPIQLQLVSPHAPYFKDADLVIAADCVPFAYSDFHQRFLKGKTLIILCPKLDRVLEHYLDKLTEIFRHNDIKSVTIAHMEVPCCFGLTRLIEEAIKRSGKDITLKDHTISIRGDLI